MYEPCWTTRGYPPHDEIVLQLETVEDSEDVALGSVFRQVVLLAVVGSGSGLCFRLSVQSKASDEYCGIFTRNS